MGLNWNTGKACSQINVKIDHNLGHCFASHELGMERNFTRNPECLQMHNFQLYFQKYSQGQIPKPSETDISFDPPINECNKLGFELSGCLAAFNNLHYIILVLLLQCSYLERLHLKSILSNPDLATGLQGILKVLLGFKE